MAECHIWQVERDSPEPPCLLVQVRMDSPEGIADIKEFVLLHEQKSLYWVIPPDAMVQTENKGQTWLAMTDLRFPPGEETPLGRFALYMETWDGVSSRLDMELPAGSAIPEVNAVPKDDNFLEPMSTESSRDGFREVVYRGVDGKELRRFLQAGRVPRSELEGMKPVQDALIEFQEFLPRAGRIRIHSSVAR